MKRLDRTTNTCHVCKENKKVDLFPKDRSRSRGLSNRCFDCNKEYVKNYTKNRNEYFFNRKNNFPQKEKAKYLVRRAVLSGNLIKKPCQTCGNVISEAHHEDYSKPLEVTWLCRKHHCERHRKSNISSL